jgi:acetyl esterase/lipase
MLVPLVLTASPLAGEATRFPDTAANPGFDAILALPSGRPEGRFYYGPEASQFVELWRPAAGAGPAPVVVFIHGGCWLSDYSIAHSHPAATALRDAGFAVWNVEYRRTGEAGGGFPGSLDDIRQAIALLKDAPPTGIDTDRMVIAGHSAGGHLALLAAKDSPAIGLAPIIDIAGYAGGEGSCNTAAVRFMGATPAQLPDAYRQATPAVGADDTILMGSLDTIVPARPEYLPADSAEWPEVGHFDWIHPGTAAWKLWLEALRANLD